MTLISLAHQHNCVLSRFIGLSLSLSQCSGRLVTANERPYRQSGRVDTLALHIHGGEGILFAGLDDHLPTNIRPHVALAPASTHIHSLACGQPIDKDFTFLVL